MCKESVNVEELRKEVMADGVVTKEEVEMLWEKKDSQEGTPHLNLMHSLPKQ